MHKITTGAEPAGTLFCILGKSYSFKKGKSFHSTEEEREATLFIKTHSQF
jgi:hypothetical protein